MITDVSVSPVQEINYFRSFTSGEPQRKRKHQNPCGLLKNLWAELERRFGSTATIFLMRYWSECTRLPRSEKVSKTNFEECADLCADVTSQILCLPGLVCLNFPGAIQPIAAKLPSSLRGKWEEEIAKFAENNGDAYPGFHVFSEVVQQHARIKNNPNIRTGQNNKALKRNADPNDINAPTRGKGDKTLSIP